MQCKRVINGFATLIIICYQHSVWALEPVGEVKTVPAEKNIIVDHSSMAKPEEIGNSEPLLRWVI